MKKTFRRCLSALMLVVLMMSFFAPAALASFQAVINSSSARVYSSASTSSRYNVKAPKGLTVTVTGYSGSWARIRYSGRTGYIPIKYLNLKNRVKRYVSKASTLYQYAGSGSTRSLSVGTAVYVIGVNGSYARVQNASGSVTGYVKSSVLVTKSTIDALYKQWKASNSSSDSSSSSGSSSLVSNPTTKIEKVVALAGTLLGRSYALSDNPPYSFNCSSFVKYCMESQGYSMRDTAAAQAADTRYASVSLSNIRMGDVLCFDTDEDGVCDHTAIALSATSFVECSRNAGKVQTNTLDSWYKSHFVVARRPA